ncbi:MAG TPA: hypothetical protein VF328_20850 [Mycobacterium sp.]
MRCGGALARGRERRGAGSHADDDYVRQANADFALSDANGTPPSVQCVGHAFVGQTPANSIEASTTITCKSQVHSMALQEFLRANDDLTSAASDKTNRAAVTAHSW